MKSGSIQGPNRTFNYNYGSGQHGKGGKVTVENNETGAKKTFAAGVASYGEHKVGGRVAYNHETGRGAMDIKHKGPNGFQRATAVTGENGTLYRVARRDESGELQGVWRGYVAKS